ncbi:calcium-binding protein [Pelomonas sp. BJYL3]|uniref:calcium-binding protein n=1 Tax=Pelomonas sp. BJYL3 TaxID=2976697 RepID=UPI0022B2C5B5|nr:calcium-binding protein [Pelomonas sp. BJYL3]
MAPFSRVGASSKPGAIHYGSNKSVSLEQIKADIAKIYSHGSYSVPAYGPDVAALRQVALYPDFELLANALNRIRAIAEGVEVAAKVKPSDPEAVGPAQISGSGNIDALRLDYQLSVLRAGKLVENNFGSSVRSTVLSYLFGSSTRAGRSSGTANGFYDVYAASQPSAVANSQRHYGQATPVFIEDQPLYRGSFIGDVGSALWKKGEIRFLHPSYDLNDFGDTHSIVLIEDSLRVQNTVLGLAPKTSQGTLEGLLRASSNAKATEASGTQGKADGDTLERFTDAMNWLLLGSKGTVADGKTKNGRSLLEGGTWADIQSRQRLETGLAPLKSLADTFKGTLTAQISGRDMNGRRDFSAFLSAYTLSPVVFGGQTAEAAAALETHLDSKWSAVYGMWLADRNLAAASRDKGLETYSDTWIAKRNELTAAVVARNTLNGGSPLLNQPPPAGRSPAASYRDVESGVSVVFAKDIESFSRPMPEIAFGDSKPNSLTGNSSSDYLFGGDGNDTITGGDGGDWLEGNAGNDSLKGGDGADTLLGGAGDDWLSGGDSSDDRLMGGIGSDVYAFTGKWGNDTVIDADGVGNLQVEGFEGGLPEGKLVYGSKSVYYSADKKVRYVLCPGSDGTQALLVLVQGASSAIRIEDWSPSRNLGITLVDSSTAPPTTRHAIGDVQKLTDKDGKFLIGGDFGYVTGSSVAMAQDVFNGNGAADELLGGLGNDGLAGQAGNDVIDGGDGDDLVIGGQGEDALAGGSGNDVIIGGEARFLYWAGAPGEYFTTLITAKEDPQLATKVVSGTAGGLALKSVGFTWAVERTNAERFSASTATFNGTVVTGSAGLYTNEGQLIGFRAADGEADVGGNVIDAGAGNDVVLAGASDDVVDGGEGDDDLLGMGGADVMSGGKGSDILWGDGLVGAGQLGATDSYGDDTLMGGEGNDAVVGQGGSDQLFGGDGDDQLNGDVIVDPAHQEISLTPSSAHGNDVLDGGAGNDTMTADGGNDILLGGDGNDVMRGDGKAQTVPVGIHGEDYLEGGEGNDQLIGGGKNDTLLGGEGSDSMWGDDSDDDVPAAAHGNDWMDGGAGNDFLKGGGGKDTLLGGEGDDQLEGDDELSDLPASAHDSDYLDGGAGKDKLFGYGGDDVLAGGAGDDALYGGDGNDTLTGGGGTDYLAGGAGDDTYVFSVADLAMTSEGVSEGIVDDEGINKVVITGGAPQQVQVVSGKLVLSFGTGQQLVVSNGAAGAVSTYEIDGVSYSYGSLLADFQPTVGSYTNTRTGTTTVVGSKGIDSLNGYGGKTVFFGGDGSDVMQGSGGQNTYVVGLGSGKKRIIDTSSKVDAEGKRLLNRIRFEDGITASNVLLTNEGGLTLYVGSPDQSVQIEGGDLGNATAATPIDEFEFADGTVLSFNQLLAKGLEAIGTEGDDLQSGTAFVDRFYATAGKDTLRGGAGSDVYDWSLGAGEDTIDDSSTATDVDELRILAGLSASQLALGRVGDDLLIRVRDGSDSIRVLNHFTTSALDRLTFADGTVWNGAEIAAHVTNELTDLSDLYNGTAGDDFVDAKGGNDTVNAKQGNDQVNGGAGNDTLNGEAGNDLLIGGAGTDSLVGGDGNDTLDGRGDDAADVLNGGDGSDVYLLGRGSGADSITELGTDSGIDVIHLDAGITPADVKFDVTAAGTPMRLRIIGTNDSVAFTAPSLSSINRGLERIEFADGTVWNREDWLSRYLLAQATSGNDTITGFYTRDLLAGGAGDDSLSGMEGDDSIEGGAGWDRLNGGDGNDTLDGGESGDTLWGGAGDDLLRNGENMEGGSGNDRYELGASDSYRQITEEADAISSADVLDISSYASLDNVQFTRFGSTLQVQTSSKPAYISVTDYFNGKSIESIVLSGGVTLSFADVVARDARYQFTARSDSIVGFDWNETLAGGAGNDSIEGQSGADLIIGGAGHDALYGDAYLLGAADGNDTLDGGAGMDFLQGGGGNDVYRFGLGYDDDQILDLGGTDRILLGAGIFPSGVRLEKSGVDLLLVLTDSGGTLRVKGAYDASGQRAAQAVEAIEFADGTVWDANAMSAATVVGVAPAILSGTSGNDSLAGTSTNDSLTGGVGMDTLTGFGGNDTYYVSSGSTGQPGFSDDTVVEQAGGGYDKVVASSHYYTLPDNVEVLVWSPVASWTGAGGTRVLGKLTGNNLDNVIHANDTNYGGAWIDGGAGADTMQGSSSYGDVFAVDNIGDEVIDFGGANAGRDLVRSSISYSLAGQTQIEDLTLTGTEAIAGTGNQLANVLDASVNTAANVLAGGAGDDSYVIDWVQGDQVVELANGGTDTVKVLNASNQAIVLGTAFSNVENLSVVGTSVTVVGSDEANVLSGEGGYVKIFGGAGDDVISFTSSYSTTVDGGAGNDTLRGIHLGTVLFGRGSGNDIWTAGIGSGSKIQLSSGIKLSEITVTRSGRAMVLSLGLGDSLRLEDLFPDASSVVPDGRLQSVVLSTGEEIPTAFFINRMVNGNPSQGTASPDALAGTAGADVLLGGAGNDTIYADDGNDTVDGGNDADILRGEAGHDSLIGGAGADTLLGGEGDDTLAGGSGDDALLGGEGSDTYRFGRGDGADTIDDLQGSGGRVQFTDLNLADVEFKADGEDILVKVKGTADSLRITALAIGDARVDVFEFADGTLRSTAQLLAMVTRFEGTAGNDTLTGTILGDQMFGLAGNDSLTGDVGNDTLDGGVGTDTLNGGRGDDTYYVDVSGDVITEASGLGTDTVYASLTWTLGSNLENLVLTGGSAINGTGNTLPNRLQGNSAANTLNGGAGADVLLGAAGDDTYVVDNVGDVVIEVAGEGLDTVQSSVSYTLSADVEKLTLTGTGAISGTGNEIDNSITGNSANNTLTGGAGADTLTGGAGNDTLIGGAGDDLYVLDVATDAVKEQENEGVDSVQIGVTYTLAANVENLTLTGSTAINGTGNGLANSLTGNGAANTLTGGAGNDTLTGGAGNDILVGGTGDDLYVLDVLGDVVTEQSGEGIDTVKIGVTYTLGLNVENLTLTGTSAISGTGNTLDNVLTGNAVANSLTGGGGADTLDGGAGNDILMGGAGADTYRFGLGYGLDTIQENDSTAGVKDIVAFANGVAKADVQFTRSGNDLVVSIRNTTDKLTVTNWYLGGQYQVEEFRFVDGAVVTASQAQGLVSAMAAFGGGGWAAATNAGVGHWRRGNMMLDMLSMPGV